MITFHQDTAQAVQGTHQANRELVDRQPSTVALSGLPREHGGQGLSAIARRRLRMHGFPVRYGSQRNDLDGHDANGLAGFAINKVTANLAGTDCLVCLGLSTGFSQMVNGRTVCIGGQNIEAFRGCKAAGEKGCGCGAHVGISCFDDQYIGPKALDVNGVFS